MKTLSVMETNARIELSDNPMILVNGYQENNTNDEIVDVVPSLLQEEVSEEKGSIKSWSPETYNGSISAEEEIVELPMAKSCEIIDDRPEPSPARMTTSTSAPIKSKKGLKGWLKKISKSRKKVSKASDNLELIEAGRERKESYTKKVENITAKYEQIVREKKASEPPPLPPPLPAVEETNFINEYYFKRPMTIKEFVSSNMFDQLKYKLTTVLRNIHFPMLPLHFSVEDNEDNLKTRLTALLELVQHHTKWNDDYSECCVISEILNQLQYLDVECVQVLLDGVKDNHQTHLQYLNYLSNFQKKCHNARLEIVSLQSTIGRLRCLQEESFLNFTISLFFEQRAARLHQVMKDLENCGTADEKYALVQDCRISMTKALEKDLIWQLWAEDLEQVHRICDDRIFAYLYDHLFHPNGDSDKERDGVFHGHIQRIAKSITPGHRLLKISPIYYSSHPWLPVQNLLNDMAIYKSPFSKLNCIIKACKLLIRLLQLARCGNPPGADDIFPVLVYVLIQANPASLLSTEQYVKTFCEDTLTGETDYWWTQFRSAVGFLRTPEFTQHINF